MEEDLSYFTSVSDTLANNRIHSPVCPVIDGNRMFSFLPQHQGQFETSSQAKFAKLKFPVKFPAFGKKLAILKLLHSCTFRNF